MKTRNPNGNLTEAFGFRMTHDEKIQLEYLTQALGRNQADTLRFLIRKTYKGLSAGRAPSIGKEIQSEMTCTA